MNFKFDLKFVKNKLNKTWYFVYDRLKKNLSNLRLLFDNEVRDCTNNDVVLYFIYTHLFQGNNLWIKSY